MKRYFVVFILAGFAASLFAAEPELSGVLESTVNYIAGAGDAPAHSWGIEEYANLRLLVRAGEKAVVFSSFNLIAMSGNYVPSALSLGAVNGENYAAAIELERLYFKINGDYIDAEAGLLRMNFGYGQVWGSSDFLNPRNPLFPNSRPRGVLGANLAYYPLDDLKLMFFAAAPRNPLESGGGGFLPGFLLDQHWDWASIQAIYAYETPGSQGLTPAGDSKRGIHRFGLSFKTDLLLGFTADMLYSLNPGNNNGIQGFSAGAGFDYSFFDGSLYVLFEYLFNGTSSVTALGFGGDWTNNHYLCGNIVYRFNDYTSLGLTTVFCFDDVSFQPMLSFDYDIFQGFSLNISCRVPLDRKVFGGSRAGELGPIPPKADGSSGEAGARVLVNAGVKLRF